VITTIGQIAIVLAALATGQIDGQMEIKAGPDPLPLAAETNGKATSQPAPQQSGATNTEKIVCGVAVVAFLLALGNARAERKHRRLSVEPQLQLVPEASTVGPVFTIFMVNAGLGPAKVETFEVVFRGDTFLHGQLVGLQRCLLNAIAEEFKGYPIPLFKIEVSYSARSYLVGEKVPVIHIEGNGPDNPGAGDRLIRFLDDLTIMVKYKSSYGKKYTARRNVQNTPAENSQ